MKTIAFMPVRGGSKSIPLKNIREIAGKPLIYWYCRALQASREIDEIVVATDHPAIRETALSFGFEKLKVYDRLPENARDESSTESVMLEWLQREAPAEDFVLMLCQATSPFVQAHMLDEALREYRSGDATSMLSCSVLKRFFWSRDGKAINYDPLKRPRRQEFEGSIAENGAFYISRASAVRASGCRISGKTAIHLLPEYFLTEIDEDDDWIVAESLLKKYETTAAKNETG